MKSEVSKEHVEQFRNKLLTCLTKHKEELDSIETVVWKKENSFALWWNSKFSKLWEMTVYDKDVVARNSLRYGFQRIGLKSRIEKQSTLLERLDYAIRNNVGVVFEDSDYNLLK